MGTLWGRSQWFPSLNDLTECSEFSLRRRVQDGLREIVEVVSAIQSMDSEESPLDVLSRAATMVSPPTYDEARAHSGKETPSAKWRRERRQAVSSKVIEGPLDFSTRHTNLKPPPPSYDQSMQNKMSRPSVIQSVSAASPVTNNSSTAPGDPQITTKSTPSDDACDPAIDEHFRRSLGKDYSSIFSKDKKELNKSDNSDSDSTGLTVDDHFAKALGDTWIKLKEKENQEKNSAAIKTNNNRLGGVKDLSNGQNEHLSMKKKKKKKVPKETVLTDKRRGVVASTLVRT